MGRPRTSHSELPRRMCFHHGAYYYRHKDGKRIRLSADYAEALRRYADLAVAPSFKRQLVSSLITEYRQTLLASLKPRTQQDYRDSLDRLDLFFGQRYPSAIKPPDIYAYMDARGAPVRANRDVAVLSNVLNLAVRKGLIPRNPCRDVKRNKEAPEGGVATDEQIAAMRAVAPDWLNAYIDLKLLVGLRQSDMLRLTLFSIRSDGLYCMTGKADKALLFTWTETLQDVVSRCKSLRRRPSDTRLFARSQNTFKAAWQYYAGKLGELRFCEKDMRSKVACDAVDLGRDATTLLAHSTDAVTRRHYLRRAKKVAPLR